MILIYTVASTTLFMIFIAVVSAYYQSKVIVGYKPMDTIEDEAEVSMLMVAINMLLVIGVSLIHNRIGEDCYKEAYYLTLAVHNQVVFWTVLELFEEYFKKNKIYYSLEDEEKEKLKLSDKAFGFISTHYRAAFVLVFKIAVVSITLYNLV